MNEVRKKYLESLSVPAFIRPDTSGIRGKGVNRKSYQSGGEEYPYDKPRGEWGKPWAYSRDSSGHMGSRQNVMTPKSIDSDDDRWDDIKEIDADSGWTSGTPVHGNIVQDQPRSRSKFGLDDEEDDMSVDEMAFYSYHHDMDDDELSRRLAAVDESDKFDLMSKLEAIGVPFNSAKGNTSGGGMHTGGRMKIGTSGQWSSGPKGNQWDEYVTDDELERAGRDADAPLRRRRRGDDVPLKREFNYGLPFAGDVATRGPKTNPMGNPEDDDLISFEIPVDTDEDDVEMSYMKMVGGSNFRQPPGQSRKFSRMQPGQTWKEGLHRGFTEAFVSLKAVPEGEKQRSHSVHDVDLDFMRDRFRRARGVARRKFDTVREPELVKFLIQIEPGHFMKSLGEIGKDKLLDIYEAWADDVMVSGGTSIERMAERIMNAVGASDLEDE